MTPIAAILLALLPLPSIVLLIVLMVRWTRQRNAIRAAGVSEASPGCPGCLYIVRGWDSSTCPECATDVRAQGVVVGRRVPRSLKLATATLVTLTVWFPFCLMIANTHLVGRSEIGIWQMTAATSPAYRVDLRTRSDVVFPGRAPVVESEVIIDPSGSLPNVTVTHRGGRWHEPRPADGQSDAAWRRLTSGRGEAAPAREAVEKLIADALGQDVTPTIRAQASFLAAHLAASRQGSPTVTPFAPPAALFVAGGSGSGRTTVLWPPARVGIFVVPLLVVLAIDLRVWRRHRPGIRPAREGEWRSAT